VSSPAEPDIPKVLVIAADTNIEALVGELVAFAGYRPIYDVTMGAAGESIRRARPAVALIDTALPSSTVRACIGAAEDNDAHIVLMSSTASANELADQATSERALHFALPGGPKQLRFVLDRAIELKGAHVTERRAEQVRRALPGSVHPSICAALASVARARLLTARSFEAKAENRQLRGVASELRSDSDRNRSALWAAVADYAQQLKQARLDESEAVVRIRDMISDCAFAVGAEADVDAILTESERWAREVFRAA